MRIVKKRIDELIPADYNPRKDLKPGDKEYEKLKKSIKEFDYVDPVIWNERTGHVVGGHQRLKVLRDLGYEEIDVSVVDLPLEKEKALNVGLNKISGDWDPKKLEDLLRELTAFDLDMELTGFDESELDEILGKKRDIKEDDFDLDAALEKIEQPITQLGDVWELGPHRLMCGDSTRLDEMQRLLEGQLADMVFTDPPYNVDYEGGTGLKIMNDKMSDDRFYQFLFDSYSALLGVTKPGGAIYVCHADSEGINFRLAMKNAGWELKQCIIWVKNTLVMGRQDHHWKHEPILYGWKPGAKHKWYGGRKETTVLKEDPAIVVEKQKNGKYKVTFDTGVRTIEMIVSEYELITEIDDSLTSTWFFDKPLKNAQHPTMKPIGLPARAIRNSSRPGEIVLDAFGGSGSTLLAAEQLGRRAYLMELDPKYCDVIVQRWEEFTGKKASRRIR